MHKKVKLTLKTSVRLEGLGDRAHTTVLFDTLDFGVWSVWHYEV